MVFIPAALHRVSKRVGRLFYPLFFVVFFAFVISDFFYVLLFFVVTAVAYVSVS